MTQYICEHCGVVVLTTDEATLYHCGSPMSATLLPDAARAFGTTHQLVYHVVREREPIVGIDVVHATERSPGTIYPALSDLEDVGVVESRPVVDPSATGNSTEWETTPGTANGGVTFTPPRFDVDADDIEADGRGGPGDLYPGP